MSTSFPINDFRFASLSAGNQIQSTSADWADIEGLVLNFGENDSGNFLVTLTIPSTWNDSQGNQGANFQLVLRTGQGQDKPLGQGYYTDAVGNQTLSFSLVCQAEVSPNQNGSAIVAQWQVNEGTTYIGGGLSSLSAVGSLVPSKAAITKVPFNDTHHWENTELFSRGLRLSNFSEILFITGYGPADVGGQQGGQTDNVAFPCDPEGQMTWITQHLDDFFKTIQYADGTGFYSKYDIVYFDLVVASTISDAQQQAVLVILEKWFGPVGDQISVYPKPATGILKKVTGLAVAGMMVEIEFTLAH
jgi:hypothetical protein